MLILGIDPGLNRTGYGCVERLDNSIEPALLEAGVIRLPRRTSMDERLAHLHDDLRSVIEELQPNVLVVEKLFAHYKHVRTSILMGHARGVVLLAGRQANLSLIEVASTEVKRAITGNGHASKRQVQLAVMQQCGLTEPPNPPDVADAIAIALCAGRRLDDNALNDHAIHNRTK